jgi:hypothetical protein
MRKYTRGCVGALAACVILAAPAVASANSHRREHLPPHYAAWARVAQCEEGGWIAAQSWFPTSSTDNGGYTVAGISGRNWLYYGLKVLGYIPELPKPGPVSLPTRILAARIGNRIEGGHYVPDAYGCSSW